VAIQLNSAASNIDPQEWEARQQLAACYRIVAMLGWDELIYNHISYRVPGQDNAYLLNPFGLRYSEVNASNLVKVDLKGNIVGPSRYIVNLGGFHFHAPIHQRVDEAHCVLHTHTTAGVAVSCLEDGLPATNSYSMLLVENLAYHDLEPNVLNPEEGPRLARALGTAHSVILKNHGLLTVGKTIPAALYRMWNLQRACEIHLAAVSAGKLRLIPAEACRKFAGVAKVMKAPDGRRTMAECVGEAEFEALIRQVDRVDTSWRE
jgi:ribulose-5-phosphate 4-epimerase/fuculose-1-phosphate aldolase